MGGSPKPCSKEFQPALRPRKTGPVAKTSRTVKRGLRVAHRRPRPRPPSAWLPLPSGYVRIRFQLKPDRSSGRTKCRRAMSRSIANTSRTNVAANRMNGDG